MGKRVRPNEKNSLPNSPLGQVKVIVTREGDLFSLSLTYTIAKSKAA